jgi:hypothetical protein
MSYRIAPGDLPSLVSGFPRQNRSEGRMTGLPPECNGLRTAQHTTKCPNARGTSPAARPPTASSFELDDDLLQDHFLGRDRVAGHIHRHELQPIA